MQALTRLNPTDPVRFDGMNTILGEIEGRDEDLLNKINVLNDERGYLTSKVLVSTDFDLLIENGKYVMNQPVHSPLNISTWWYAEVTTFNTSFVKQVATNLFNGDSYFRIRADDVWQPWQPVATTTSIPLISRLIGKTNQSLNQTLQPNYYRFFNATAGFPSGYNTDNDFILVVFGIDLLWQRHLLLDIRSNRSFLRSIFNGSIQDWREF